MSLLLLALAWSSEPFETWQAVHEAMLRESLDGDLDAAEARYTDLVHNVLPSGDPALARALLQLGRVRDLSGNTNGAREALDACVATGMAKAPCLDLRAEIDLEADAVRSVPVHWTFDDAQHGFLHPRAYRDKGVMKIETVQDSGESVLAWVKTVDAIRDDMLVVGFQQPSPPPRSLRMQLTSVELDATLRIEVEDVDGHRYTTSAISLDKGVPQDVRLSVSALRPLDEESPPVRGAELHRMYLVDVSGTFGQVGTNVLRLDDFQVR